MSAFGPSPIQPVAPGAVQASFIAQQSAPARPREKTKPQDADPPRRVVRDEVRIQDPLQSEPIDPKPDAAEEWKYRRNRGAHPAQDQLRQAHGDGSSPTEGVPRLDVKA